MTFLTNHARAPVSVQQSDRRLRDVAIAVGITERMVQRIVAELAEAGYLKITKEGRCNRYGVNTALPAPSLELPHTIGELMKHSARPLLQIVTFTTGTEQARRNVLRQCGGDLFLRAVLRKTFGKLNPRAADLMIGGGAGLIWGKGVPMTAIPFAFLKFRIDLFRVFSRNGIGKAAKPITTSIVAEFIVSNSSVIGVNPCGELVQKCELNSRSPCIRPPSMRFCEVSLAW